jgi:hypothetical protein
MRLSVLVRLAVLSVLMAGCLSRPLLYDVQVAPEAISPDADGRDDVTRIEYKLRRSADLSIYFLDAGSEKHYFRDDKRRSSGQYSVYFGGVVEGRMLPDGTYTWVLEATDLNGYTQKVEGPFAISGADTVMPELRNFSVYPQVFTPNQDGIDDRVTITFYLNKEVRELRVYVLDAEGNKHPVAQKEGVAKPRVLGEPWEPGVYTYDYEGGVDLGATPPPDGTYTVIAEAEDLVGNKVWETSTLTIEHGGVPRADIVNAAVEFYPEVVPLGGTLTFTATVENFGSVPIRTTGPPPGTTYTSSENFNSLGWYEEPGAWRFGIDFEGNSSGRPYPYRFAIGSDAELTVINGEKYLMPGQWVTIVGHLQIIDKPPRIAPHYWAGLIHEDVRIVNDHIDPQVINIGF